MKRRLAPISFVILLVATVSAQDKRVEAGGGSIRHAEPSRPGKQPAPAPKVDYNRMRYGDSLPRLEGQAEKFEAEGRSYRRIGDHFFEEADQGDRRQFVLSRPPIGARVNRIPQQHETVTYQGRRYLYWDDVYYEPAPGGVYVVVEPPIDAPIYYLPPWHQTIVVGDERLIMINGRCFRPIHRRGRLIYVRCPCPVLIPSFVQGTLRFDDRGAVPPFATIYVRLVELDQREQVRRVVARQIIRRPPRAPIPFDLHFDPREIHPQRAYAVDAEVHVFDRVLYEARRPRPVLTAGRPNVVDLVLQKR